MNDGTQRRIAAGIELADRLKAEGRYRDAQVLRDLCHTATGLRMTASTTHRELEDTRRACGLPTWERNESLANESRT